jgi:hypothetical protein
MLLLVLFQLHLSESRSNWASRHLSTRGSSVNADRVFVGESSSTPPSFIPFSSSSSAPLSSITTTSSDSSSATTSSAPAKSTWPLPSGRWATFTDLDYNDDDFEDIGTAFAKAHPEHVIYGQIGAASAILIAQRPLVDFGVQWINTNRK